jgi:hypothetical protein
MIQGRRVLAGIVGVVCAIAVLSFMALLQAAPVLYNTNSGTYAGPDLESVISHNNTSRSPSLRSSYPPSIGPVASQAIDSPAAIASVALLAGISILVSAGLAVIVSRRLDKI